MLPARYDDDDDIYIYMKWIEKQSNPDVMNLFMMVNGKINVKTFRFYQTFIWTL